MRKIVYMVLLVSGLAYAQDPDKGGPGYLAQVGTVFRDIPIEGSPYFNEQYRVGKTQVNGKTVRLLMRHNALTDQIELKDVKQKEFNMLQRSDLTAEFGGRNYIYKEYRESGKKSGGYFIPLNEGRAVLFFKPKKVFVQAVKPDNGYDTFKPPVYKDVSSYFLKIGDQPMEELTLNRGNILKAFKDKAGILKTYVSRNNLNLRNEVEVLQLLEYYNSL